MRDFLNLPTPLWTHLITFSVTWAITWYIAGLRYGYCNTKESVLLTIIRFSVVAIWIFGMAKSTLIENTNPPPLYMTGLFAAVAGSLDTRLGVFISKYVELIIKKK